MLAEEPHRITAMGFGASSEPSTSLETPPSSAGVCVGVGPTAATVGWFTHWENPLPLRWVVFAARPPPRRQWPVVSSSRMPTRSGIIKNPPQCVVAPISSESPSSGSISPPTETRQRSASHCRRLGNPTPSMRWVDAGGGRPELSLSSPLSHYSREMRE